MNVNIYQVDAFSDRVFGGNPAAVVPLESWPDDALLQAIAAENNLAETAYFVPAGESCWQLRWFTPTKEVALCGHATLASAFVLYECLGFDGEVLTFETRRSGKLHVTRKADRYWLDLPRHAVDPAEPPAALVEAMGAPPGEVRAGPNWLLRYPQEADIRTLSPDMRALIHALDDMPERCVIATAPADAPGVDFVSRFFAPNFGIDEDPVTGSAHCMLAPYWADELGKRKLSARQISARGGTLECVVGEDRVQVGGSARLFLKGLISGSGLDLISSS